ncbi:hypothetical protein BMS3Bbin13_00056 [bacterium BMS3Bbin13]|nr:hypothetical protein BMS3Bbin13_00056 [bacterium BMS3Bbin13]
MANQRVLFSTAAGEDDAAYLKSVREDLNYSYGERAAEMLAACFIEANEELFKEFLKSLGIADLEEFFRCGLHHWLRRVAREYADARAVTALKLDIKGSLNTISSGPYGREADYRLQGAPRDADNGD